MLGSIIIMSNELVKRVQNCGDIPSLLRNAILAYINATPSRDEVLEEAAQYFEMRRRDGAATASPIFVVEELRALKSSSNTKEAPGEHKIVAGLKETVAYAQGDRLQGRETKMGEAAPVVECEHSWIGDGTSVM
ncbi:MAG TPA: hypothetical protein DEP24_14035, partial [Mycobacterium sp.]|nr:hypothetical protein [Mycobacterium sp.]